MTTLPVTESTMTVSPFGFEYTRATTCLVFGSTTDCPAIEIVNGTNFPPILTKLTIYSAPDAASAACLTNMVYSPVFGSYARIAPPL